MRCRKDSLYTREAIGSGLTKTALSAMLRCMAYAHVRSKVPSRIRIPDRCHPLAAFVFAEMKRQNVRYDELEWRAGVLRSTFKAWRTNNRPGLDTIEAALGALGWTVQPVPVQPDTLPPELRADLEAVAERHGLETLPALEFIALAAGRRPETIDARTRIAA